MVSFCDPHCFGQSKSMIHKRPCLGGLQILNLQPSGKKTPSSTGAQVQPSRQGICWTASVSSERDAAKMQVMRLELEELASELHLLSMHRKHRKHGSTGHVRTVHGASSPAYRLAVQVGDKPRYKQTQTYGKALLADSQGTSSLQALAASCSVRLPR